MISTATGCSDTISKRPKKDRVDCQRVIYHDFPLDNTSNVHSHKLAEIVTFKEYGSKGYALCIGINPKAACSKAFDRSNQKIARFLKKNNYQGYYLLNMFSIVSENAAKLEGYLATYSNDCLNDCRVLIDFILQTSSCPIVLFGGEKLSCKYFSQSIKDTLRSQYLKGRTFYLSVDENDNYIHVGSSKCGGRTEGRFLYVKLNTT